MTFCLGARPLHAPPLIAHRLTKPSSALALRLVCRKADACGIRPSFLMWPGLAIPHGSPRRLRVPPDSRLVCHRNPIADAHRATVSIAHPAMPLHRNGQPFTFINTDPNQIERN